MARLGGAGVYVRLAALVALLGLAWLAARLTPVGTFVTRDGALALLATVRGSASAPVLFAVVYALATALALPGSVLTIVGGAAFGFGWGAVLTTIGANLGANAAFGIARALGRGGIQRLTRGRLGGLDRATEQRGFWGLLVLRLIPLVPFNALNFGAGLTAMRWRDYAAATLLGILPGTLVYTFFADALVRGSTEASHDAYVRLWIAAGLLLLLSVLPLMAGAGRARSALPKDG
ncbi:MAG: VTT domain-containing protein [Gemmatimonadota bacterium]|nr:VTT domain-containing protein [Gemmatimonadota bacterium]